MFHGGHKLETSVTRSCCAMCGFPSHKSCQEKKGPSQSKRPRLGTKSEHRDKVSSAVPCHTASADEARGHTPGESTGPRITGGKRRGKQTKEINQRARNKIRSTRFQNRQSLARIPGLKMWWRDGRGLQVLICSVKTKMCPILLEGKI